MESDQTKESDLIVYIFATAFVHIYAIGHYGPEELSHSQPFMDQFVSVGEHFCDG